MKRNTGIHFYINIPNFDDVVITEEEHTGKVNHSIHALDTFFSSIEQTSKNLVNNLTVEKVTGSRLHMYIECDRGDISVFFKNIMTISLYTYHLSEYLIEEIGKYKILVQFDIQVGACFGSFYDFEFKNEEYTELTTIGYASNYAAKLQSISGNSQLSISENIYQSLSKEQKNIFRERHDKRIKKYDQEVYYYTKFEEITSSDDFSQSFERAKEYANRLNLSDIEFSKAKIPVSYKHLSRSECKEVEGIPLLADVRDFTCQFDSDDTNLEEMTNKTQNILTSMYSTIKNNNGIHVQFQGDRELALFHNYGSYSCIEKAVISGLRIIENIKEYGVCVGVGQAYGRLFATRIGARGEKDNILLGKTVTQADKNEDEKADKNQLVISKEIYEKLKLSNDTLASLFTQKDEETYYTSLTYSIFKTRFEKEQLLKDKRSESYNGAWGQGC